MASWYGRRITIKGIEREVFDMNAMTAAAMERSRTRPFHKWPAIVDGEPSWNRRSFDVRHAHNLRRLRADRRDDFVVQISDEFLSVFLDVRRWLRRPSRSGAEQLRGFSSRIAECFLDLAAELFHRLTSARN